MPGYYLGVVCALCTLLQVWTNSAFLRIALVFAVAVPVGGAVLQYLVARTDVAIIKLIIYIVSPELTKTSVITTLSDTFLV